LTATILTAGKDSDLRDLTVTLLMGGDWSSTARAWRASPDYFDRCERYWQQQRITPVIARILSRADRDGHYSEWCNRVIQQNGLRALHHIQCLTNATRLLGQIDIPVMPIKGVVLASMLHGDPGYRHCGDIDLVVHAHRFDDAVAHLLAAGYQCRNPEFMTAEQRFRPLLKRSRNDLGLISPDGSHVIELHHRLCKFPGFLEDDFEALYAAGRGVRLGGTAWVSVGDRDLLAYLAFHAMTSRWGAMKWLLDVAHAREVSESAAVDAAYERATRGGFLPLVDAAFALGARLLGKPEPEPRGSAARQQRLVNDVWQRLADGRYAVEDRRDPLSMARHRMGLVTGPRAQWRMATTSALNLLV
jgi:hypothetical protein